MKLEGTITISKDEYLKLMIVKEQLSRLERGGVDNWEWYGEAINPKGEPDIDDWEDTERERVKNL